MGADIHMYVEYRSKEPSPYAHTDARNWWSSFGDRINPGRSYRLFGLLAGVRCDGVMYQTRGMPEDAGYIAKFANQIYISDSGDGESCTLAQAQSYEKYGSVIEYDQNGRATWVTHPDWHSHSWLTVDQFSSVLNAYRIKYGDDPGVEYVALLAAMRALENDGKNEVRVVFWFDN